MEYKKIGELQEIAKELGIKYIKKYKKADLIEKIRELQPPEEQQTENDSKLQKCESCGVYNDSPICSNCLPDYPNYAEREYFRKKKNKMSYFKKLLKNYDPIHERRCLEWFEHYPWNNNYKYKNLI